MPDIEPKEVGVWDDTQLEAIDQLMIETKERSRTIVKKSHDFQLTKEQKSS